jgi:hypothetical protein
VADIRVKLVVPYALRLNDGDYPTSPGGEVIRLTAHPEEETRPQMIVSATFSLDEVLDAAQILLLRFQLGDRLLRRTNHLLRWYRAVRRRPDIAELTRAQASPFLFEISGGDAEGWTEPLWHEEKGPISLPLTVEQLTTEVRAGLATGNDPDVAALFLLDAELAVQQGRFREAVLFCWSTIDSVFNRKYDQLVQAALVGELSDARDFFTGHDFGLKRKMSAGMHLFANRSLFREPGGLWDRMTTSYGKRNAIIHQGENATEDEARQALAVAQEIVQIMNAIPVVPSAGAATGAQPKQGKRRK